MKDTQKHWQPLRRSMPRLDWWANGGAPLHALPSEYFSNEEHVFFCASYIAYVRTLALNMYHFIRAFIIAVLVWSAIVAPWDWAMEPQSVVFNLAQMGAPKAALVNLVANMSIKLLKPLLSYMVGPEGIYCSSSGGAVVYEFATDLSAVSIPGHVLRQSAGNENMVASIYIYIKKWPSSWCYKCFSLSPPDDCS